MKKFFTLLLSSLFSLSLFAYDGSHLSISTVNNNMRLKIEVDGQNVMMQGNSITLNNFTEGNHNVRIYREKKKNIFNSRLDRGYEIIYATSVYLGRAYQVDITINEFGRVILDSYRIETDNGYGHVLSAWEFDQVKEQIRKEWFEANKLASVKTIIDKNNFTTQQVFDLMSLFTFESNKLELAKYAYCSIVDLQNYFRLNDALTFESSKDELARFIRES